MVRKWIAVLPLILTASLITAMPAVAAPASLAATQPESVKTSVVQVRSRPSDLSQSAGGAIAGKLARWPSAGSADVTLGAEPQKAGQLPVYIGRKSGAGNIHVDLLDKKAGWQDALILRVSGSAQAQVSIDYGAFETAHGADWAGRLKMYALPECALSTPDAAGCRARPLKSSNDRVTKRVSADTEFAANSSGTPQLEAAGSSGGMLMALAAGPSSDTGDYSATKLQPSSTWAAGGSSGDFSWNYPLAMPPSLGGPSPKVELAYSSSAVDGRTLATNNQPGWIGQGFEYDPGHIERRYTACADDMGGTGANNTTKTGDLCWGIDNASMTLSGHSGELIKDDTTGVWKVKNDDGTRIERLEGTVNGAWNNEYWRITTPDGTQYYFGLNHLPGWASGKATTDSVWTVPVAGNNSGERCHQSGFTASFCAQAWRWNLDYVVDVNGNTMSYWYTKDTNMYGRNLSSTDVVTYDRDGVLKRIDYGTDNRSGTDTIYTAAKAPMEVDLTTSDRCLTTSCGTHDAVNWPDTPWDQECTGSPCNGKYSPVFFSSRRLTGVATKVMGATDYRQVDSWAFTHQFPPTGSGTPPGLWLESVQRAGMPEVNFDWVALENRVDTYNGTKPTMNWHRMSTIWTDSGGKISVSYTSKQCVPGTLMPSSPETNTLRCYPVLFDENGTTKTEYFHKYLVNQLTEADLTGGSTDKVTTYEYPGTPAWRYTDDNGISKDKFRTWADYRGYDRVLTKVGAPGQETLTETVYMRGMHGSKDTPSGGTRNVVVSAGIGPAVNDENAFAGMVRQTTEFNGADTAPISRTVNVPWQSGPTSTRNMGDTTVYARYTGNTVVYTSTMLDAGRGWRTKKTVTAYDSLGMADYTTDYGLVSADGQTDVPGDETCTDNTYLNNTSANILGLVQRVQSFTLPCGQSPSTKDDVLTDERRAYDGLGFGVIPAKGMLTQTDVLKDWTSATGTVWLTSSRMDYDALGRQKDSWDIRGNQTAYAYTPATGGPLTRVDTTTLLGTSYEDRDPAYGKPTSSVDINNKRTDLEYDAMGRLTKVWLPNRSKTTYPTSPNTQYSYLIRNTGGVNAVTTSKLNANGNYITTYTLYDGLLRPRQTQSPAFAGGGTIFTETGYDAAGREAKSSDHYYDSSVSPSTTLRSILDWQHKSLTVKQYDRAGRTIANIFMSSGAEKWRTSTSFGGDRTYVTPPSGGTPTTTITDIQGRTVEVWQQSATSHDTTKYAYNRKNLLDTVTDTAGNRWIYEYDMRGQVTATTDPDHGRSQSTYNDYGDAIESLDALGNKLAIEYDSLGRKKAVYDNDIAPANLRASWAYDPAGAKGKPASSSRWTGSGTSEYKVKIRGYTPLYAPTGEDYVIPAAETGLNNTYTFTRTYKVDGSPATFGYPNAGGLGGETLTFTYDDVTGKPEQVQTNWPGAGQYVSNSDYTAFGELGFVQYQQTAGSWLQRAFVYDDATRQLLQDTTARQIAPQQLADVHYTFDAAGNVRKIADGTDTQCFTPDYLGRLLEAWTPSNGDCSGGAAGATLGGPAPYRYLWDVNSSGNRTKETGEGTVSTYAYPNPGQARPHAVTSITTTGSGAGTKNYDYDVTGNLTCRPTPGATSNTCGGANSQALGWDSEGRLATVTGGNSYLYNADGTRLIARDSGGTTLYLPSTEIRRTTSGAVTATRYYTHNSATVAMRTSSAGLTWLVNDQQGTESMSIDAGSQTVSQRRKTPFGTLRGTAPSWPDSKGFVGGDIDPTGLTHIGARDYDPVVGKFISVDPVFNKDDPQSMNNYAYADNSPVTRSDPSGACIPDEDTGRCMKPNTPTCSQATPEYCHKSGDNKKSTWDLGWQWLAGLMMGCQPGMERDSRNSCHITEYFRDGDPWTELIKKLPFMDYARTMISGSLGAGKLSGEVNNWNSMKSTLGKALQYRDDMEGLATWGGVGSQDPAFFLGSFDLDWSVTGYDGRGNAIVEFHLLNATTKASGMPNPMKLFHYGNGGRAGDGSDAEAGELWLQQSVRWREPIPIAKLPTPQPGPSPVPPSR